MNSAERRTLTTENMMTGATSGKLGRWLVGLAAAAALAGCSGQAGQIARADGTENRVRLVSSQPHEFTFVRVDNAPKGLLVHGKVEYPQSCADPDRVDVTVRGADGAKIAEVEAPIKEARTEHDGMVTRDFSVRLMKPVPNDALVKLALESGGCHQG